MQVLVSQLHFTEFPGTTVVLYLYLVLVKQHSPNGGRTCTLVLCKKEALGDNRKIRSGI